MSVWSYRLGSSSLFTRTNEGSTEPKRVVFLSVEGTKTEVQYLHFIRKINEKFVRCEFFFVLKKLLKYTVLDCKENIITIGSGSFVGK